jgi:hypothetical protein
LQPEPLVPGAVEGKSAEPKKAGGAKPFDGNQALILTPADLAKAVEAQRAVRGLATEKRAPVGGKAAVAASQPLQSEEQQREHEARKKMQAFKDKREVERGGGSKAR